MTETILAALGNHLWQSTLFAAAAGTLTLVLRANYARTRYWVWLTASLKFLLPFSILARLGSHMGWLAKAPGTVNAALPAVFEQLSEPFAQPAAIPSPTIAPPGHQILAFALAATWLTGFAVVILLWFKRCRRVAAVLHSSKPITEGREFTALQRLSASHPMYLRMTNSALEPGVFGVFRAALLWPAGISEHLSDAQMDAIIAHELCHARHRDNLAAAVHMSVEAIFWFHPLVWWLGARLVEERERACDEEVLRMGSEPEVYAESLLQTCRFCLESPLICTSSVLGSSITKRVEAIMTCGVGRSLDFGRKLMLTSAGIAAVIAPVVIGVVNAPRIAAQTQSATPISFQSATIQPSENAGRFMVRRTLDGRVTMAGITLEMLIALAYDVRGPQIAGGPPWIASDRFDIDAKTGSAPGPEQFSQMIGTLLSDRFHLKYHHETREMPVYTLTVAKSGLKIKEDTLGGHAIGTAVWVLPGLLHAGRGNVTATGASSAQFAASLSNFIGRTVVDKTGLTGRYDFHLTSPDASDPSLFSAIEEQMGLDLDARKAPIDILVIDDANKPSEN